MPLDSRRQFVRHLALTWGSMTLVGCGGGKSGSTTASTSSASDDATSDTSSAGQSSDTAGAPGGAASAPATITPPTPVALATDPAWITTHPLRTWFAIPGTVHAGSAAAPNDDPQDIYASSNRRLAYSGMGLRGNEIIQAANGGHGDYSGNEVTSIDLSADAPAWTLRSAASTPTAEDVPYYADGRPSSRHTYWSTIWSARHNRLMLHYSRFVYGAGVSFTNSNGFNLDTNTWDPQGTWSNGTSAGCADANGDCYAMGVDYFSLMKWTSATDTWSTIAQYPDAINVNPVCHDSKRDILFALAWGDGQGNSSGVRAIRIAGATKTEITFNPSAALTQFQADTPAYSAMEYDPVNDQYLFYEGAAGRTGRVYVVIPNATAVWDLQVLALGDSTVPPAAVGAGVFSRFKYVSALRGYVLMSAGTSELYFLRTS